MAKNNSERKSEPAQPILRGINLARFLCESCPFHHNTKGRDRRARSCSGLPPVGGKATTQCEGGPLCADDLGLPGRL